MTLHAIDPLQYSATVTLIESELVRFLARPALHRLDVVLIHTADTLGEYFRHLHEGGSSKDYRVSQIDFRLLSFRSVAEVCWRRGPTVATATAQHATPETDWSAQERALTMPRGRLITNSECESNDGAFRWRMYFDSFGEYAWSFSELLIDGKVARVVSKGSAFEYWDNATNSRLDPKNPFHEKMPPRLES